MPILTCTLHHHIGSESAFEKGLNVTSDPEVFDQQIAWFEKNYDIIDLETLLSGPLPKRPLLLTFDDVFLSIFEAIRDVLAPRGLPSVYFINSGLLSDDSISLDSTLAWASEQIGLPALCRMLDLPERASLGGVIVSDMARYGSVQREAIKACVLAEVGPPDLASRAPLMGTKQLKALAGLGAEVGNHSATHVHMRALDAMERQQEIASAKTHLEELSGQRVRSFSIPYGDQADLTPDVLSDIRASGHQATFLVHARNNRCRPAPDVWFRTSLRSEAPEKLQSHIVYKPLLRMIRNWI